jgi:hypothetical protein
MLPRWSGSKPVSSTKLTKAFMEPWVVATLDKLFGQTASWASNVNAITIRGLKYRCVGGNSGDANIGYISPLTKSYAVGKISKILKVRINAGADEAIVMLVNRHCEPPVGLNTHIWHHILAHRALGMRVVGVALLHEVEVIPLTDIVGHVAVNRISGDFGGALVTLQLAKVRI